ncbi:putative reverse transcriptase domain-containing protein, partial [Tanacetum coccineum]
YMLASLDGTEHGYRRTWTRGQDATHVVREYTFAGFMKSNPTVFCGVEGAVELQRWFEKTSECAEGTKTVNRMPWNEMKQLMTVEFCPIEEVQRMERKLWNMRVKEYDIESVKVDAYIRGLSENIKGEVTSSRPTNLNEAVRMAHKLMEQKSQARNERILEGKKRKWENFQSGNNSGNVSSGSLLMCERCFTFHVGPCMITCHKCGKQGHTKNRCPKKVKQEETREVRGRAYAIKDAEPQGPNVVTSMFLLNNHYASFLFDLGSDRSFVDTRFSSMLDIDPVKIDASYEVELADGRVVSTNC